MHKKQLVEELADRTGSTKRQAEDHLDALQATITDHLREGESVRLPVVGKFFPDTAAARKVTNEQGVFNVPERTVPKFKVSNTLRKSVSEQH